MSHLTRSQEREERTKMGRGLLTSVFALFFCWVPVIGLLLGSIGCVRIITRMTEQYRARFIAYLTASLLILALCVGVFLGEIWLYCGNPNIVSDTGLWLFQKVTGQESLPTPTETPVENYMEGMDYSGMDNPGMGLDDSLYNSNEGAQDMENTDGAEPASVDGSEEDNSGMNSSGDASPDAAQEPAVG